MAEELRIVLTIIGVLLIGGIFGHGLWSIRKNKEQLRDYKEPGFDSKSLDKSTDKNHDKGGLDNHGVGKPRKLGVGNDGRPEERAEPVINAIEPAPEPANHIEPSFGMDEPVATSFDHGAPQQSVQGQSQSEPAQPEAEIEPSEVLIIHVSMPDNQTISGASLLPLLISMGFKFGEMDIFHRHQDTAGTGPVLFSLASMFNPGTFDIDNMEQIATKGLSLFMTLPCHGEALQNFNMMHNAAKKVAEEFGAQLLDSKRSAMTVQTVRHYVEKIREFERQQLING
ncbi:MAG: cell division protein ZipA [Algicola sp.]|nr:cell division protein ZipA [Algicola sp.]